MALQLLPSDQNDANGSPMPCSCLPRVIELWDMCGLERDLAAACLDELRSKHNTEHLALHDPTTNKLVIVLQQPEAVLNRIFAETERVFRNTKFDPLTQTVHQGNSTMTLLLQLEHAAIGLVGSCESRRADHDDPKARGDYNDQDNRENNTRSLGMTEIPDLSGAAYLVQEPVDKLTTKVLYHIGQLTRHREEMNQLCLLNSQLERMIWNNARVAAGAHVVIPGDDDGKKAEAAIKQMNVFATCVNDILEVSGRTIEDMADPVARDKVLCIVSKKEGTALPYRTAYSKGRNKASGLPTYKIKVSSGIGGRYRHNPTISAAEKADLKQAWDAVRKLYVYRRVPDFHWNLKKALPLNTRLAVVDRWADSWIDWAEEKGIQPESSDSIQLMDRAGVPVRVNRPGYGISEMNILEYGAACLPENLRNAVVLVTCEVRLENGAYMNPKTLQVIIPGKFVYGVASGKRAPVLSFPSDNISDTIRNMVVIAKGRGEESRKRNIQGLEVDYSAPIEEEGEREDKRSRQEGEQDDD